MNLFCFIISFFLIPCVATTLNSNHIRGMNWFGMETEMHTLEGLYAFPVKEHIERMKGFGFNTVRVPFAMEGVWSGEYDKKQFEGNKSSYDILHELFQSTQRYGMGVVLDHHRLFFKTTSPLWHSSLSVYNAATGVATVLSENNVLMGLQTVLTTFEVYPNLLGLDLYNEPHHTASFHTGNQSTDFEMFLERCMNELVVREGVLFFTTGINWGQDMREFRFLDTRYNHTLVLSPHAYGPTLTAIRDPAWESDPSILWYRWDVYFGFLQPNWTVVIGEFGADQYNDKDMMWLSYFVRYIYEKQMGWMFWAWNPSSKDVQGFLEWDWKTPNAAKKQILQALLG